MHSGINFVSKCLPEQMFEDFFHSFCAKVAAEATAIFLLVYFIIDFVHFNNDFMSN